MYLKLVDNLKSRLYSLKWNRDAGFRECFQCLHYNIPSEDYTIILKDEIS